MSGTAGRQRVTLSSAGLDRTVAHVSNAGMRARFAGVALTAMCWPSTLAAQVLPLSPEVPVNTYTTDAQRAAAVASDGNGNFVVVWQSLGQDGSNEGVFGRRWPTISASHGSA